ncbi:MAG: hypothetical protein IPL79_16200 [Myxococcales bacterium]|nr:hypothetical protein [Myxococcales bacterium]
MAIDKRGKLGHEPFTAVISREAVHIYFRGRLVDTLVGPAAEQIRAARANGDEQIVQLIIARKTGNFKRGNER